MQTEDRYLDFCLLIPCYNNMEGLILSLNSVSYHKDRFLVVIVDDGSEKPLNKDEIENRLAVSLPFIVLRIEQNKGITNALNTGLEWIRTNQPSKYIARLDCADTCDPERFYIQVEKMDANPEIGLMGSWCIFEEKEREKTYRYKTPVTHKKIVRAMYFKNVFIHPTVMFRSSYMDEIGLYPVSFELAEDYAYFWEMMLRKQTIVVDKFLVTCELNRQGISYQNKSNQLVARQRVIRAFGKNKFLTIMGIIKLALLFVIPKQLLLLLKQLRG